MTDITTKRIPVNELTWNQLYTLIGEESAEIGQCAMKCLRFGIKSHHPDRPMSNNFIELMGEFCDLLELIQEIDDRMGGEVLKDRRIPKDRLVYSGGVR